MRVVTLVDIAYELFSSLRSQARRSRMIRSCAYHILRLNNCLILLKSFVVLVEPFTGFRNQRINTLGNLFLSYFLVEGSGALTVLILTGPSSFS